MVIFFFSNTDLVVLTGSEPFVISAIFLAKLGVIMSGEVRPALILDLLESARSLTANSRDCKSMELREMRSSSRLSTPKWSSGVGGTLDDFGGCFICWFCA